MARKKLYQDSDYIQIVVPRSKKATFDAVCAAKETTMSEVLRQLMDQYLAANKEIVEEVSA
jgi:hypothetical protein